MASSTLPVWSACIASTPPWKGGASHGKLHTSSVECLHCQYPTLERWGFAWQAPHFQCGVLASPVPHLGKVGLRTASSTLPVWSACIASTPPWKGGASPGKLHTSVWTARHTSRLTATRLLPLPRPRHPPPPTPTATAPPPAVPAPRPPAPSAHWRRRPAAGYLAPPPRDGRTGP